MRKQIYRHCISLPITPKREDNPPYLNIDWESSEITQIETLTITEIKELYKLTESYHHNISRYNPKYLFEAIASRDKAILTVFYGCGLRRNEGYHLNIRDIYWERSILHVRKGKL